MPWFHKNSCGTANHRLNRGCINIMSNLADNRVDPINMRARRRFVMGAALAIGTLSVEDTRAQNKAQQTTPAAATTGTECRRTSLHQVIDFHAGADRVYEALLDSKQFTAFSGAPAQIDRDVGGEFTLFGGLIGGRNIELVSNERIVQAWRPTDWSPGVYSLVKFELLKRGSQTQVVLDHTGFPEGGFEHLNSGWKVHYWDPLGKYLS
jgi:activator of HSP90 ATPase